MILREIFCNEFTEWEEKLVAATLLNQIVLPKSCIASPRSEEIIACLSMLADLPADYARHLCVEVLGSYHVDR